MSKQVRKRQSIEPTPFVLPKRPIKKEPASDPKLFGILVKDYFSIVGSFLAILGVSLTIYFGGINTGKQIKATELSAEQKQNNDLFVDFQNRLSKTDNPAERINAINSLVELAQRLDPQFRDATDSAELAERLNMPADWIGKLKVNGSVRPCERAYPYFKPVALRLASTVQLDKDPVVRNAAVRACGLLCKFSQGEIAELKWPDFESLGSGSSALPLTKYLVESLAQSNREAANTWRQELARFIGVAQALGGVATGNEGVREADFNNPAQLDIWRNAQMRKLLPKSKISRFWTESSGVWELSEALCPFFTGPARRPFLLRDVILEATKTTGFENAVLTRRQKLSNSPGNQWNLEWIGQQETLGLASAQLISTRDAIATVLRGLRFTSDQLRKSEQSAKQLQLISALFGFDLRACMLTGADFSGAMLPGTNLENSKLQGTSFSESLAPGLSIAGANLDSSSLSRAKQP